MAITNASTLAEYASGISTQGATLTVDANNKRVGIGTTNPQAMLQVGTGVTVFGNAGIASFTSLKLSGETDSTSVSTGALTVTGGVGIGLSLTVGGDVSVGGTITYEDVTNVDSIGIITARSGVRIVGGGLTCVGIATFAGITTVTNTAAFHSKQLNVSAGSTFGGAITASDTLTVAGDVDIADKIVHTGDTNTAIRFPSADTITAETGGSERFRLGSTGEVQLGTTSWPTGSMSKAAGRVLIGNDGDLTLYKETNSAGGGASFKLSCKEGGDATKIGFCQMFGGTENTSDQSGFLSIRTSNSSGSGVERLHITSGGCVYASNFGIGTDDRWKIRGNNSNADMAFEYATSSTLADSNIKMVLKSTGRVGVGTNQADTVLSVYGDSNTVWPFTADVSSTYAYSPYTHELQVKNLARDVTGAFAGIYFHSGASADGSYVSAARIAAVDTGNYKSDLVFGTRNTAFRERVRITAAGLVGIGTTAGGVSSNAMLSVHTSASSACRFNLTNTGSTTTESTQIYSQNNDLAFTSGGSEAYRIDSSGRLLINTNATRAIAGGNSILQVENNSSELATFLRTSNDTGAVWLALAKSRSSAGAVCNAGDNIGAIAFIPHDGIDLNHHAAEIRGYVDTGITSNDTPGYLTFHTNGGTTTTTERLRIKSDGEILIGTGGVDRPIAGQGFNSGSGWSGSLQLEKANPSAGNNTGCPFFAITAWNGVAESYTGGISFNRSNSNTQGTQGAVTTAQELGNISFNGSDGTNFINGAEIYAIPDATYSTNSAPTQLVFATTVTGTSDQNPKARVRINSKGFTGPLARTGCFQGTYVYRQRNQSSDYEHYIRGPLGGYISSDLTGDNQLAYIQVQCMGTGTDNAWCYYRYSRDASSGASQVNLDHLSGGSSGNSNVPYMALSNGEASWKMAHSTNYYVVVRVVVIGGTNEITYSTTGEYFAN